MLHSRTPVVVNFVVAALGLLLSLALSSCPGEPASPPTELTIAYLGNYQGFQRPCGCATKQSGGLPRLGTIFTALTAATILILLCFLAAMNALAIYLRKHFERRW